MKYFDILYQEQPNVTELDAPVLLKETAIIKDTVDNEILLRNTMVNISEDDIAAIAVRIKLWDVFGEIVQVDGKDDFEYVYQDILVGPGEYFGNKVAINLPDSARRAEVSIEKTITNSGKVWNTNPDNIVDIQPPREIEGSEDFITGLDDNAIKPLYYYAENLNSWQCTCGQINKAEDTRCRYCGREKSYVKDTFSEDVVKGEYAEYDAKIKEQQNKQNQENQKRQVQEEAERQRKAKEEQELQEQKEAKNRKILRNILIACGAVLIVVVATIVISNQLYNPINSEKDNREKISYITSYLGRKASDDGEVDMSDDVQRFFNKATLFGQDGYVNIFYDDSSVIYCMMWTASKEYDDASFKGLTDNLMEFYGEYYIGTPDFSGAQETYLWSGDIANNCQMVACCKVNSGIEQIRIYWFNRISDVEDFSKTETELEPYLDIIGQKDNGDGTLTVSQEIAEGASNVYFLGNYGYVEHSTVDGWDGWEDTIACMTWTSTDPTFDDEDFKYLLFLMNEYYGTPYQEESYENISDECYVWMDDNDRRIVVAYYEDNRAVVDWYLNIDAYTTQEEPVEETQDSIEEPVETGEIDDTNGSSSRNGSNGGGRLRSGSSSGSSSSSDSSSSSGNTSSSLHTCAVSGCNKAGVYSIQGISGQIEYYCAEHYKEMQDTVNGMMEDIYGN